MTLLATDESDCRSASTGSRRCEEASKEASEMGILFLHWGWEEGKEKEEL